MKKVLVLGSKPGASFGAYDYAICANAAASFYAELLDDVPNKLEIIVSASELIKSRRKNVEKEAWLDDKFNRITNIQAGKFIIYGSEHFPDAIARLQSSRVFEKCEFLTTNYFRAILAKLNCKTDPVFTKRHLSATLLGDTSMLRLFAVEKSKNFLNSHRLSHSLFRQGTGANALLYAINKFGKNAEYFISGIGKSERQLYADGSVNVWTPKKRVNSNHVFVDLYIFEKLQKIYNITYDKNTYK